MGIFFIVISSLFASVQNFFMRRSQDHKHLTQAYVPTQLTVAFLINILLNPVKNNCYTCDLPYLFLGMFMGLLVGLMMWSLASALKYGSVGITFSSLNASSVFPAVLMGLAFGSTFGHPYHWWTLAGSILVILGIFWSSRTSLQFSDRTRWVLFITTAIASLTILSCFMQWRVLLEDFGAQGVPFLPFKLDSAQGQWLAPAMFFSAAVSQFFVLGVRNVHLFSKENLYYGTFGGLANGISLFFMVMATNHAFGWQNAILYPLFSIAVIASCNVWGKIFYNEKIAWTPNAICITGIIIGSVHWSAF